MAVTKSLKGQVVWITGASSGIGEYLAVRLAKVGVRLALSARSVENLERVKQRCIETGGVTNDDVLILPLDMIQYDQHQPSFDSVLKHFGELDILVSNAGRSQRGRWEMIDSAVDREIFELNVFSLISLSRIVTRYFLKRGRGHHAVTSSTAGKLGAPLSASYTGSKHALQGYFECLRMEKAGIVDVTMFCPGPVDSNILKNSFTEQKGVLDRIEKRASELADESDESCVYSPVKLRSSIQGPHCSTSDQEEPVCFFCDQKAGPPGLHNSSTFGLDKTVRMYATKLRGTKLLTKLAPGDMVASTAIYHKDCLTNLFNRNRRQVKLEERSESVKGSSDLLSCDSIALAELISYIEEQRLSATAATVPVFRLADLVTEYSERLTELSPEYKGNVNSTRLKERVPTICDV
ncbi:uncharacterized oxidoreductase SSP1627 [Palaemon carinicauda]|uniref:uncharacterized oxidoreductase SSP1627 n=1 Tax=Palaemon carinicauda TaxID=392227 RepID=UPI0035B6607D